MKKRSRIPANAVIGIDGCFSTLPQGQSTSESITVQVSSDDRISYYLPERPITDEEVAAIQEHYATHGTTVKFFELYSRWPLRSWVKEDHPFRPQKFQRR